MSLPNKRTTRTTRRVRREALAAQFVAKVFEFNFVVYDSGKAMAVNDEKATSFPLIVENEQSRQLLDGFVTEEG